MTRIPVWSPLLLSFALCACGNKGPLVLPTDLPPEETAEAQTPAATDAGAEADPLPADQTDALTPALPTDVPAPVEPEPATPPDDTDDDDPPGDG